MEQYCLNVGLGAQIYNIYFEAGKSRRVLLKEICI